MMRRSHKTFVLLAGLLALVGTASPARAQSATSTAEALFQAGRALFDEGKTDEAIAEEGLKAMEAWMKELGLAMNISELGATEDMIDGIADGTFILEGGYKVLDHEEIVKILKESL